MNTRFPHIKTLPLLIGFVYFCSCQAQEEKKLITEWPLHHQSSDKLIKTQGSNAYDNVHCGIEDKAGHLWFGTTGEGVYRYDGKSFQQFTKADGLNCNTVWAIMQDRAGIIWFGTNDGICQYDGQTFKDVPFNNLKNNSSQNKIGQNSVYSILQDHSGKIWFGTDQGLYYFQGNTFAQLAYDLSIMNKLALNLKEVQCIFEDKNHVLWFGSGPIAAEGLVRYDGQTLEQFKPKNETWIRSIAQSKNGNLIISTRHVGTCLYDGKNFTFNSDLAASNKESFMSCFDDRAGNQWLTSDYGKSLNDSIGGLWRNDGKTITRFTKKDGLTNTDVFFLLEDNKGNIWIGTRNVGLYCYDGKRILDFNIPKN